MDKTIHVPVDLHEALKVKAAQQRVTLAVLVERVLRAVVEPTAHTKRGDENWTVKPSSAPIVGKMIVTTPVREREYVYDDSDSQVRRR